MDTITNSGSRQYSVPMADSRADSTDLMVPLSPTRGATTNTKTVKRHTKGLSLNFPILLPNGAQISHSPIGSGVPSPIDSARSSPRLRAVPFRSPDPVVEPHDKKKARASGEFLTLLAAQERRVLELKEELQRAEKDLQTLKKQWASHEADKKRDDLRNRKKLEPVAMENVGEGEATPTEEEVDEDRRRKRALVERSHAIQVGIPSNGASELNRKGSQRVFEGGRHTRTLSLLSPTSTKPRGQVSEQMRHGVVETEDERRMSLSRMPTLESLMSSDALALGFGKTYKDLAAHRKSLPPVATDLLVKQGKQVYDGMKDGLWTFFEDIRQATVGDEGINGTAMPQRPIKQFQRKGSRKSDKAGQADTKHSTESARSESKDASFWKEFGFDTPQRKPSPGTGPNGHIQQKRSTDSSNPPSLLPDSNDTEEVEDGWDTWDSPRSNKMGTTDPARDGSNKPVGDPDGGLQWPEIQRDSPKLTRTISDLMKEWDSSQTEVVDGTGPQTSECQMHILDSPHI